MLTLWMTGKTRTTPLRRSHTSVSGRRLLAATTFPEHFPSRYPQERRGDHGAPPCRQAQRGVGVLTEFWESWVKGSSPLRSVELRTVDVLGVQPIHLLRPAIDHLAA